MFAYSRRNIKNLLLPGVNKPTAKTNQFEYLKQSGTSETETAGDCVVSFGILTNICDGNNKGKV